MTDNPIDLDRRPGFLALLAAVVVILISALVFVAALTTPASAAIACGGQNAMHQIPAQGDHFECEGSRQLADGQTWWGFLTAYPDGTGVANVRVPVALTTDILIEFEVHYGLSGDGGVTFNAILPAGQTGVAVPYNVNLSDFAAFGCLAQMDLKAFNGNLDTATNKVRILGPSVVWPNCFDTTTTVTSSPTTSPTSPPASSGSTTTAPTVTSVVGGTIPATGPTADLAGYGIVILFTGLFLLIYIYARKHPAS